MTLGVPCISPRRAVESSGSRQCEGQGWTNADGPGRRFPIHWAFVGIFLAAPGTPLRREQPPLPEALGIRKTINELDCVSDNTRRVESAKAFYRLFKDHLEGVLRGKVGEILEEEDVEDNAACGKICGILRDLDRVLLFDLEDGEEFRRRLNEGPLEVPRKRKRRSEKERFYGIHTVRPDTVTALGELFQLIMLSLQDVVFEKVAFQKVDAALKLIRDDREGKEGLDMVLVKEFADALTVFAIDYGRKSISYPNPNADAVIQGMVLRLQRSVESFGRRLVEDVAACFEKTKADLEREEDLVRYLRKVELIMEEETQRSRHYLNHRWRGALQKAIATMFLEERSEAMASEFRGSMATNRREVAKLIYKLSSKTQGAKEVREIFSEIVTIEVRRAIAALKVEEQTDPRLFITTAMGKADEYRNLLAEVFDSAAEMVDVFERAFEEVLGKNATVELLARFAD
ncbi:hypothetical protein QR680_013357 [Steinernema hermaphroditum]|uniref:Cullin N-terminal domain-containing protein n=1 Tax=Steinernema hermaphroditum TaxID=289476 RepID=A0AA39I821_9BILA|nr:hypothetical protein QR680_013357 [Steinernema hermaphroditum]